MQIFNLFKFHLNSILLADVFCVKNYEKKLLNCSENVFVKEICKIPSISHHFWPFQLKS